MSSVSWAGSNGEGRIVEMEPVEMADESPDPSLLPRSFELSLRACAKLSYFCTESCVEADVAGHAQKVLMLQGMHYQHEVPGLSPLSSDSPLFPQTEALLKINI